MDGFPFGITVLGRSGRMLHSARVGCGGQSEQSSPVLIQRFNTRVGEADMKKMIGFWVLAVTALVACGGGVEGTYVNESHSQDYLELRSDGTFFMEEGGQSVSGSYRIDDAKITLSLPSGAATRGTMSGDVLIDSDGDRWVKGGEITPENTKTPLVNLGSATSSVAGVGVPQELMSSASHIPKTATVSYNTTPPTSGDHWFDSESPAACGFYEDGLDDQSITHNLEHSNIVVSYNLPDENQVDELKSVIDGIGLSRIWGVTRSYDKIPAGQVAVAAWGMLDTMDGVDADRLRTFFETYAGSLGPEIVVC